MQPPDNKLSNKIDKTQKGRWMKNNQPGVPSKMPNMSRKNLGGFDSQKKRDPFAKACLLVAV